MCVSEREREKDGGMEKEREIERDQEETIVLEEWFVYWFGISQRERERES